MNKIYMIYMAAGNSRRFSGNEQIENKLLYEIDGKPMYQYGLQQLQEILKEREDCSLVIVTQYPEIYDYATALEIPVLLNPDSTFGASYTIRAGISYYQKCVPDRNPEEDYYLFMVADQPYIQKNTIEKLIDAAQYHPETASVSYAGKPGNPTLLSVRFEEELLALQGDEGGRKVMKRHECIYVAAESDTELFDIDKKEETKKK